VTDSLHVALPPAVLAARHRLLTEIGEVGVARLAASVASLDTLSRPAAEVARTYLERSAVTVTGVGQTEGDESPAAAQLRGALYALEHIARTVGVVRPELPLDALLEVLGEP